VARKTCNTGRFRKSVSKYNLSAPLYAYGRDGDFLMQRFHVVQCVYSYLHLYVVVVLPCTCNTGKND